MNTALDRNGGFSTRIFETPLKNIGDRGLNDEPATAMNCEPGSNHVTQERCLECLAMRKHRGGVCGNCGNVK